jgi:hypothetical protein
MVVGFERKTASIDGACDESAVCTECTIITSNLKLKILRLVCKSAEMPSRASVRRRIIGPAVRLLPQAPQQEMRHRAAKVRARILQRGTHNQVPNPAVRRLF